MQGGINKAETLAETKRGVAIHIYTYEFKSGTSIK